jgi:hypothetical protein
MELSGPELIQALIASRREFDRRPRRAVNGAAAQRRRPAMVEPRRRRPKPFETAERAPNDRRKYCQCGQCRQCLENARWERIFAEKFADPDYYTGPVVRSGSSLTSF